MQQHQLAILDRYCHRKQMHRGRPARGAAAALRRGAVQDARRAAPRAGRRQRRHPGAHKRVPEYGYLYLPCAEYRLVCFTYKGVPTRHTCSLPAFLRPALRRQVRWIDSDQRIIILIG